jgi:hypothetical protein
MIDGSPVTFESHDLGGTRYRDPDRFLDMAPYTTEFVGEGFHVLSRWCYHPTVAPSRSEWDRAMLEQAGVDTATVEHGALTRHDGRPLYYWEKLWPPKDEPAAFMGGGIKLHYHGEEYLVGESMFAAGAAVLHDVVSRMVVIEDGKIRVINPHRAVARIYKAMLDARSK